MDGQDKQDEESADLRFQISNLLILLILPIYVNSFRDLRAADLPCPYSPNRVLHSTESC